METSMDEVRAKLLQSISDGNDVTNLIHHAGWKHIITHLQEDALDAFIALKDINLFTKDGIEAGIILQNKIHRYTALIEALYSIKYEGQASLAQAEQE